MVEGQDDDAVAASSMKVSVAEQSPPAGGGSTEPHESQSPQRSGGMRSQQRHRRHHRRTTDDGGVGKDTDDGRMDKGAGHGHLHRRHHHHHHHHHRGAPQAGPRDEPRSPKMKTTGTTTTSMSTSRIDASSERVENMVTALSVDEYGWCVIVNDHHDDATFAPPPPPTGTTGANMYGEEKVSGRRLLSPRCLHLLRLLDAATARSDVSSEAEADGDGDADVDDDGDKEENAAGSPAAETGEDVEEIEGESSDRHRRRRRRPAPQAAPPLPSNLVRVYGLHRAIMHALREVSAMKTTLPPKDPGPSSSPPSSKSGGTRKEDGKELRGEGDDGKDDDGRGGDAAVDDQLGSRTEGCDHTESTPSSDDGVGEDGSGSPERRRRLNVEEESNGDEGGSTENGGKGVAGEDLIDGPDQRARQQRRQLDIEHPVDDDEEGSSTTKISDTGGGEDRSGGPERQHLGQRQLNGEDPIDDEESSTKNSDMGGGEDRSDGPDQRTRRRQLSNDEEADRNGASGEVGGDDGPAWYRAQVTMNSLRSILPVVRSIVDNSRPLGSRLVHQLPDFILRELNYPAGAAGQDHHCKKGKKRRGGPKHRVMLLCPPLPAYDVCTEGELREMSHQLDMLFGKHSVIGNSGGGAPPPDGTLSIGPLLNFPPDFAKASLDIFHPGGGADGAGGGGNTSSPSMEMATRVDSALFHPLYDDFRRESDRQRETVDHIQRLITNAMRTSHAFRSGCRLSVYGSSLSGLSLHGSDVDLSLEVPLLAEAEGRHASGIMSREDVDRCVKDTVFRMKGVLQRCGFSDVFAVHRARVPVVKGRWCRTPVRKNWRWKRTQRQRSDADGGGDAEEEGGGVNFDICFQNDRAVVNSTLLREYSDLDERVRILMLAVKMWAKARCVASAADGTLSSYSWMNLVVFYLQCLGFVPNLQSRELAEATDGRGGHSGGHQHGGGSTDGSEAPFLSAKAVLEGGAWRRDVDLEELSVTALLYGFFNFYSSVFHQSVVAVSIRVGRPTLLKTVFERSRLWRLCIEDPFETHDATYHHDLGMHIKEVGQPLIERELRAAAVAMRTALTSCSGPKDHDSVTGAVEIVSSLLKNGTADDDSSEPTHHHTMRNGVKGGQRPPPQRKNGKHHPNSTRENQPHGTTPAQDHRHGSKSQVGGKRIDRGGRKPDSHPRRGQQHNSGSKAGQQHGDHPDEHNLVSTQQHGRREHDVEGGETPKRHNSERGGGGGGRGRSGRGGHGRGRGRGRGRGVGGRGHGKREGQRKGQGSHSVLEETKQPHPPVEGDAPSKQ